MKVLFVCSGNKQSGMSPIIQRQAESIEKAGIYIDYFKIVGKGLRGYLMNVIQLRRYLHAHQYDLIHAHYAYSSICMSLTLTRLPKVVSLMGSDIYESPVMKWIVKYFIRYIWKQTIVKSKQMANYLNEKKVKVIPNGVNFQLFKPANTGEKIQSQKKTKSILFVANPTRPEKNYALANEAYQLLNDKSVHLDVVYNVNHHQLLNYYQQADMLLLTSKWEGSPNVIKEAMACNLPIVSTNVGDVSEVIENTEGCYLASFEPGDVTAKIRLALNFGKRTNGRDKISHLDSEFIAQKIITIYNECLKK